MDDYLDLWVFGQAPAGATDGPYEVFVTAHTGDALPGTQQLVDLMWVGAWAPPPPSQLGQRVYLLLLLR